MKDNRNSDYVSNKNTEEFLNFDFNEEYSSSTSYDSDPFDSDDNRQYINPNGDFDKADEAEDEEFENAFEDTGKDNFNEMDSSEKKGRAKTKKKTNAFSIVLFVIAGILILIGVVIIVRGNVFMGGEDETYLLNKDATDVYPETEDLTPLATPISHYDRIPVKFHFVDRSLSCNIIPVGLDEDGSMASTSSEKTLAWLSQKPYVSPGEVGNAVLAGHNLWKQKAGIFSYLKKMNVGEKVAITFDDRTSSYFEVVEKYECKYNDYKPMETDGFDEPVLTLITCKGDWNGDIGTSNTRVVVICKPVSSD